MALAPAISGLAWDLVKRPGGGSSDADRAVRLSRQTTSWQPEDASGWRALGVAYYRLGDWAAAAEALKTALDLDRQEEPLDLLFLAAADRLQGSQTRLVAGSPRQSA